MESFPFTAIVGQDDMKTALTLNIINPLLGGILIYKQDKEWIVKEGKMIVVSRIVSLFLISVAVVVIAMLIFDMLPSDPEMLVKTLIVGSYPAMAGAITFTIT